MGPAHPPHQQVPSVVTDLASLVPHSAARDSMSEQGVVSPDAVAGVTCKLGLCGNHC